MSSEKQNSPHDEPKASCERLQTSKPKSNLVKQDLIQTPDKICRDELCRYKNFQAYNEKILRRVNDIDFGSITALTIVEAFNVEIALVCRYREEDENLVLLGSYPLKRNLTLLPFKLSWLSGDEAFIADRHHPLIHAWSNLNLCEAMICPFFKLDSSLAGILLGGRKVKNKESFPEINAELLPSFKVLTEQASLLLEIREYSEHLEELVEKRTTELRIAQAQLVETAHRAGMAEIATGILHNIGNSITGIYVNVTQLLKSINKLNFERLLQALKMIKLNLGKLDSYLVEDSRGEKVLPYMELALNSMAEQRKEALADLKDLNEQVANICEIVTLQQSYAKGSRVLWLERRIDEILMNAIRIQNDLIERYRVTVETDFSYTKPARVESHQLLQVFVNIIKNAIESIITQKPDPKVIHISNRLNENTKTNTSMVEVVIKDNGIGFIPELKDQIFNYGFTTRKTGGMGFGLHFCANYIQSIGGSIKAESEGSGKGATFIIKIPLKNQGQKK